MYDGFMITWVKTADASANPIFNGTCLRAFLEGWNIEKVAAFAKTVGLDAYDNDNYYDRENGYDGFELHGLFEGAPFQLYTRWGVLRIGGHHPDDQLMPHNPPLPALDVEKLKATLANLVG